MIAFIKDAIAYARQRCVDRSARAARFAAALAFNKLHTYSFSSSRAGEWMCPSCHRIHKTIAMSVFSGRQFPACCGFAEGHRLDQQHATGI